VLRRLGFSDAQIDFVTGARDASGGEPV